jgi:EAL domain-containing protein (putative c-di-GMP-specific phosphodiesterase class I)
MPEMDGNQLMVWLAEQGCMAHILIVSGMDAKYLQQAEANGRSLGLRIAGSMQKPLHVDKMQEVFRNIYDAAGLLSAQDLLNAISNQQFHLVYQPQIDMRSEEVIGFEALARWNHPRRGSIPPNTFIPVLEDYGKMNFRVAINFFAANFHTPGLDEVMLAKCINKGVDLSRMTVEIAEPVAMTDTVRVSTCLKRLHEYGARISIDDFGTGHSSLIKLHEMPFTELKIHQSFIADCLTNPRSAVLVPAMVDLAHNLDMKVVAEGVESQHMMRTLREWGCDIGQGFFISPPLPPQDVMGWLEQRILTKGGA